MIRALVTATVFSLAASAVQAFDIAGMTEQERDIFRAEIRDYLLENPEVLMEAIAVLEERRAAEAAAQEDVLLEEYRAEIFDDGHSWIGGNPAGDVTIVEFLDYRCAGDAVYEDVHNALMEWSGPVNRGALNRIAKETGVPDHAAVLAQMDSDTVTQIIASNRELAQALQIQGTPSFIMGDTFVRGYVDLQQMEAIVADIRDERG